MDCPDRLTAEAARDTLRLLAAFCAQPHAGHATAQDPVHDLMGGVSYEEEHRRHGSVRRLDFAVDEADRALARLAVRELLRRRLHEVAGRTDEGAADAAVAGQLGAAHR